MNSTISPEAYQAFQKMTEDEWSGLFNDLLAYTISLVRDKVWRQGLLPKGFTEKDIVQRLVKKTITGERSWDPERIDLRTFLFSQIKSFVSHLFDFKEYKHETHSDVADDDLLEKIDREMLVNPGNNNPYTTSPEGIFLDADQRGEEKLAAKKMVDALIEQCTEDPELEEVLFSVEELLERGMDVRPRDIAEHLGVTREDVYNRIKRLKRRLHQVQNKTMQAGE